MPYKVSYSDNPFGVTTIFYGVVTDDDLIQSCIERTASTDLISELRYIKDDLLEVSKFNATVEGIKSSALFAERAAKVNKQVVHIAIASEELIYGMARMWQAYSSGTQWKMNIESSREDGDKWLEANIRNI